MALDNFWVIHNGHARLFTTDKCGVKVTCIFKVFCISVERNMTSKYGSSIKQKNL